MSKTFVCEIIVLYLVQSQLFVNKWSDWSIFFIFMYPDNYWQHCYKSPTAADSLLTSLKSGTEIGEVDINIAQCSKQ